MSHIARFLDSRLQAARSWVTTFVSVISFSIVTAAAGEPVVDMHVHVGCVGSGGSGCFVSPKLRKSPKFCIYQKAMGFASNELEKSGDAIVFSRLSNLLKKSNSVDAAIVLALDGVVTGGNLDLTKTQLYIPNEFLAEGTSRFANLFWGASVNPYRKDAIERLVWARRNGAVLVKWIPQTMEIDPSDKRILPFYEKMRELGLPLVSHVGDEAAFLGVDQSLGDPQLLELPLRVGLTVIAPHLASAGTVNGQSSFDRLLDLVRRYPNLYVDNSALTEIHRARFLIRALEEPLVRQRMLFGTDWPLQFFPLVSALNFPLRISPSEIARIQGMQSSWDRDVAIKRAIGVSDDVFKRAWQLLNLERANKKLRSE